MFDETNSSLVTISPKTSNGSDYAVQEQTYNKLPENYGSYFDDSSSECSSLDSVDDSIENDEDLEAAQLKEVNEDENEDWRTGLLNLPVGFSPPHFPSLPPFPLDITLPESFQVLTQQLQKSRQSVDQMETKFAAFDKMADTGLEKIDNWLELISRLKLEKKPEEIELSGLLKVEKELHDTKREMHHVKQCCNDHRKDSMSHFKHIHGLIVELLASKGWVNGHWCGN
ncbi:hypothetical protein MFRU_008g00530 [Monilinia fructicola]|uniref:Uncharacterized protein n=1 Tax=Monilinia fructicola TaxID=38448 RepID=A0A5M9JBX7_MONFR|nr:hypothetical protein EYC84_010907 [Monilinia fructicola]KAG4031689.1 hypothetical protein MFRU_008g00530 [Monilinia fructicola]